MSIPQGYAAVVFLSYLFSQTQIDLVYQYFYNDCFLVSHQWAHFPHIHFGLMPDQGLKKTSIQNQVKS
jgi:hypothetical protein